MATTASDAMPLLANELSDICLIDIRDMNKYSDGSCRDGHRAILKMIVLEIYKQFIFPHKFDWKPQNM